MTPRQFLRDFSRDSRLDGVRYFPVEPVAVRDGDRVGVVLMNLGGPHDRSEVETILYRRWMDPVIQRSRFRSGRHYVVSIAAKLGSRQLWKDYEQIGGECPINRRSREQASALQECLNGAPSSALGVTFKTYLAMRYGYPSSEDAMRELVRDEITKVVLLPLYPQCSVATTGTSLAYWSAMLRSDHRLKFETSAVLEYAAHPDYLQALSERIDEALQRFPKRVRPATHIVFCAEHPSAGGVFDMEESFLTLIDESVRRLVAGRGATHKHHVTFFGGERSEVTHGYAETRCTLNELAADGVKSVLLVPMGLVTDRLWTSHTLDIALRQEVERSSIQFFEVASALNCHPLFITALSRIVCAHVCAAHGTDLKYSSPAPGSSYSVEPGAWLRPVRTHDTVEESIKAREWVPTSRKFRPAAGA